MKIISDLRLHLRSERLKSENSKRHAEKKLLEDQLRLGNIRKTTLIGHIGNLAID